MGSGADDIKRILLLYINTLFSSTHSLQDPANGREALLEAMLDEQEGADMLMVKPGERYI